MSPLTDKPRRGLRPKAQTLTAAARHRPDVGGSTLGRAGSRQKMPIARPGSPACQRVRPLVTCRRRAPLTPGRRVSGCSPPPSRCAPRGTGSREPAPLLPARTLRFPWKPQNVARRAGRSDGNLSMRRGGQAVPMETSACGAEGGSFRWKPQSVVRRVACSDGNLTSVRRRGSPFGCLSLRTGFVIGRTLPRMKA